MKLIVPEDGKGIVNVIEKERETPPLGGSTGE